MTILYNSEVRNNDLNEFITPPQVIKACLSLLTKYYSYVDTFTALDPGCNLGQWGNVLKELFPFAHLTGVELMDDFPYNHNYDYMSTDTNFLVYEPAIKFDVIIGNPPYSVSTTDSNGKYHHKTLSFDWVKHSLDMLKDGGHLLFILRDGFNHSLRVWKEILNENPMLEEHLLLPRPNFYGNHDPRTDGSSGARYNYSCCLWEKGNDLPTTIYPMYWRNCK